MRILLGSLPLVALVAVWAAVATSTREWRLSLLAAFLILAAFALAVTEALSAFDAISAAPVAVPYAILGVAALVGARRRSLPRPDWRAWLPSPWILLLLAEFAVLVVVAAAAVPNNWDSMTYHMAKVAHWQANGSIAPYATENTRQIYLGPLAEIGILHLQVLADSDRLANFVQLLAFAVSVVGVSVIARNLGLGRGTQIAAAFAAATLPIGVAEAVTTQNDYVTAAFVVCAAAFTSLPPEAADAPRRIGPAWWPAISAALSLSLATATKTTALLFGFPVAVWFLLRHARRWRPGTVAGVLGASVVLFCAVNAGQALRNVATFSDPLGPPEPALTVARITPDTVAGNVVRDSGYNLGILGFPELNVSIERALRSVMTSAGISPDEPDTLFGPPTFSVGASRNEDLVSSPGHWLLFLAAAAATLVDRRLRRSVGPLVLVVLGGYVLFAAVLKWQPWGARLMLPTMVLAAVPVAALLARLPRRLCGTALTLLLLTCLPLLLLAERRPLLGSDSILRTGPRHEYFVGRPERREPFEQAAAYVRSLGVSRVGMVLGYDEYEYPLQVLLQEDGRQIDVQAVDVTNPSARYLRGPRPDVVICVCERDPGPGIAVRSFGLVQVEVAKRGR